MASALVPHSVTAPGTIRVWVGIADHGHEPRISWRLHSADVGVAGTRVRAPRSRIGPSFPPQTLHAEDACDSCPGARRVGASATPRLRPYSGGSKRIVSWTAAT